MQRVLLIGILGTYNYGCEAIVRGTTAILRKIDPQIDICYASYDYKNDCNRLKDLNIKIIKRPSAFKRFTFKKLFWKVVSLLHFPLKQPFDTVSWIKRYDTVFSIGGDMYTLSSKDEYRKDLPLFFEECKKKGLRYILWGASVGPFTNNPEGEEFYKCHLQKADLIVSREKITTHYLKSIGITKNVREAPDPAFFVEGPQNGDKSKIIKRIGLNLSPLSASHEYKGDIDMAMKKQAKAIIRLLNKKEWEIVMIPHVVSPRYWEDDLNYMKRILDYIPENIKSRITIVDNDPGFVGLKPILNTLDCMIAARMHCAINSICCQIPVILLSYSEKAKGMCNYVYNDFSRTLPLTAFEDVEKIIPIIENTPQETNLSDIVNYDFSQIFNDILSSAHS